MQPKKLLCALELNCFQLTGEIKKRNQSNSSIFTKNRWRRYFCTFKNQNPFFRGITVYRINYLFYRLWWNVLERKYCAEKKLRAQNLLLKICRGICPLWIHIRFLVRFYDIYTFWSSYAYVANNGGRESSE